MHRIYLLLALTPLPALPSAAIAQPATQTAAAVDGPAVAAEVKRLLNAQYVLPELRAKFAAVIDKGIASGRYDVSQPEKLVELINADLTTVTPDKHLGVMYDPKSSAELAAAPANAGADDAPPTAEEIAAAERRNHGIIQLRVLPGNIRYLESDGFLWAGPSTERAYDTAMAFLAGGDAVIIDMRKNGGGSPDAVRYLVSHFTEPNKPLMTFYMGSRGTNRSSALSVLRAPSLVGKPLYVLTSGGSASAAEEFVGHVAGYKLGELVGERTAGAGFRNEFFALPGGMTISISVGQAILVSTGKGWEGVGFNPDTAVPVDQALDMATARAMTKIAESAPPARAKALRASSALMEARINPVKTELPLAAYAGVYGERTVQAGDKGLTIRRGENPVSPLIAVGPNRFAYVDDPASTVTFAVSAGKSSALHLVRADGSEDHGERSN